MVSIGVILVALVVLLILAGLVVGGVVLVIWLSRRGAANTPVKPPSQPPLLGV